MNLVWADHMTNLAHMTYIALRPRLRRRGGCAGGLGSICAAFRIRMAGIGGIQTVAKVQVKTNGNTVRLW